MPELITRIWQVEPQAQHYWIRNSIPLTLGPVLLVWRPDLKGVHTEFMMCQRRLLRSSVLLRSGLPAFSCHHTPSLTCRGHISALCTVTTHQSPACVEGQSFFPATRASAANPTQPHRALSDMKALLSKTGICFYSPSIADKTLNG